MGKQKKYEKLLLQIAVTPRSSFENTKMKLKSLNNVFLKTRQIEQVAFLNVTMKVSFIS